MSKKRYIFNGIEIEDNKKGIEYNTFMKEGCEKIANQLNKLEKENEMLKKELSIYREGLRAEIRETKEVFEDYSECVDESIKLKEENERLKQTIGNVLSLLVDIDFFSEDATNHDTIAYREILKFDNKDAFSIASNIKFAIKILEGEEDETD